jgi:Fic family protein
VTPQADSLYKSFPDFSAWGELTPSDIDLWNRFAANLNERRQSATPETLKSAVEVAVRAAALDTGAIEGLYTVDRGFTMTVAFQSLAWEQAIEERGAGVRELFEAQLQAYELVLDAVTRNIPISEAWIRALHEKLCAPQKTYRVLTEVGWQEQELPKGQYKTRPNHVRLAEGTFHAYAPVDQVPEEMHRLLEQIRTPEFEAAHPVLQASYCHYAFVVIHPFADGNGRVARALASIFFYRAQSIPLVIFANQRIAYLNSLQAADLGDFRPVLSFFRDRGIDTMQLIGESLRTSEMPQWQDLASRISSLSAEKRLPSVSELLTIAVRILDEIDQKIRSQAEQSPNLVLSKHGAFPKEEVPLGFKRAVTDLASWEYRLGTARSAEARFQVDIIFSRSTSDPFPLAVWAPGRSDNLEIRMEDVRPELSESLKLRLTHWVQRRLAEMLRDLEEQLQS